MPSEPVLPGRLLIRREMRTSSRTSRTEISGHLEVDYAYQDKDDLPGDFACPAGREKPWGTGHAVWAAREALQGVPFAVINADDFTEPRPSPN